MTYEIQGLVKLVTRCGCSKYIHPPSPAGVLSGTIYVPLSSMAGYFPNREAWRSAGRPEVREFRRDESKPWVFREVTE